MVDLWDELSIEITKNLLEKIIMGEYCNALLSINERLGGLSNELEY